MIQKSYFLESVEEVTADSLIAASKSSSSSSISKKKVYGVTKLAQLRKQYNKPTDKVEVLSITDSELDSFNFWL